MRPTKFQRIQELKNLLASSGKLNKEIINVRISNIFDCSVDDVARALYRDLEELVRTNEVKEIVYTRDMQLIEEYDPAIHKNVYKEWCIPAFEGKLVGQKLFEGVGGYIFCSPILRNDVSIKEGSLLPERNETSLYFSVATKLLSIHIKNECFPVRIIISRASKPFSSNEIDEIQAKYGLRSLCFKLPLPSISSYSEKERLGHACLQIYDCNEFEISDLNSSNGTSLLTVCTSEALELISRDDIGGELTSTQAWSSSICSGSGFCKVTGPVVAKRPSIVRLSQAFAFLLL